MLEVFINDEKGKQDYTSERHKYRPKYQAASGRKEADADGRSRPFTDFGRGYFRLFFFKD